MSAKHASTPGSSPSRVTTPTLPSSWVTWFIVSAAWTLHLAAVSIITRWTQAVALCPVPAGLTGLTGAISGRAGLLVFTETTANDRDRQLAGIHRRWTKKSTCLTPTSLYNQYHTSRLHRGDCRTDPGIPGGTHTARWLGYSYCVWDHSYTVGHRWVPTSLLGIHTRRFADYMATCSSCKRQDISAPSGPCGTDTDQSAGRSQSPQMFHWHTGMAWSSLACTSPRRRYSFRERGGSDRAGHTCRYTGTADPSGWCCRCTPLWRGYSDRLGGTDTPCDSLVPRNQEDSLETNKQTQIILLVHNTLQKHCVNTV